VTKEKSEGFTLNVGCGEQDFGTSEEKSTS